MKFDAGHKQMSVSYDLVPATITHMGLFDRLYENGIARKDGAIVKCMELHRWVPGKSQLVGMRACSTRDMCKHFADLLQQSLLHHF